MVIHLMHASGIKGALLVGTTPWAKPIRTIMSVRTIPSPTTRSNLARYLPCGCLQGQPHSFVNGFMVKFAVPAVSALSTQVVVITDFFGMPARIKSRLVFSRGSL